MYQRRPRFFIRVYTRRFVIDLRPFFRSKDGSSYRVVAIRHSIR